MGVRSVFKRLCLFLIWLALVGQAYATTRYVRTTGSNAYSCAQSESVDTAKQTIAAGLLCMSAGDTLIIKAGTYIESIGRSAIPSGINDGSRTIVRAETGETVVIKPSTGNSDGDVLTIYDKDYITVQDLIIDGTNVTNRCVRIGGVTGTNRSSYITMQGVTARYSPTIGFQEQGNSGDNNHIRYINCIAHHNGTTSLHHGIYPSSSVGTVIQGCIAYANAGHGIHVYASTGTGLNDFIISGNTVYDNGSYGIGVYFGNNQLIYNNVIYHNGITIGGSGGLRISSDTAKVYNNTIYDSTGYGIRIESSADGTILQNNITYSNSGVEISNAGTNTNASNNLCDSAITGLCAGGNPRFVNAATADFHLQTDSPAIGAGATIADFSTDFDGTSRPQGSAWDLGAFEYISPASITLLGPVGGENWQVGSSQTFTWSTVSTSENVDILLSRNGTFSDTETLFNNLSDDGSEAWTVAGATTSTAKARARLHTTTSTYSTSPAAFSISASVTGTITLSAPPSGLHVFPTGSLGIAWTYEGVSGNCQIQLSRDGGVTWETVAASVPIAQGAYVYTVPTGAAYSLCVVKVTSLQDTAVSGTSSQFRIGGTYMIIK